MASRPTVLLLIAASCATALAAVQDPQRPTFKTEANFVRVDVYATLKGASVRDLKIEDFEVREDGVPQRVSTFEYVQVRTGTPNEFRNEPNTIQQSLDALKNPRARVFVLFLDVPHVTIDGTWNSRQALTRMLDRLMGPEDLIGIMTTEMAPSEIVFARKTSVIEGGLLNKWPWGERHTLVEEEQDKLYKACYSWPTKDMKPVPLEMIVRRKERATLNALFELVRWLRDQREERKAIITVSEGWLLFKPNTDLTRPRIINETTGEKEPVPGPQPIGVGPGGKITIGPEQIRADGSPIDGRKTECDNDRLHLSLIDNAKYLRDIMDLANSANASFYTIDPRGLAVFDNPIGPEPPPSILADAAMLKNRTDALRTLAENTDGLAVIGNNNLEPGLRRISDDLTSYYLLGYYSSNTKLDGRFRRVSVKVGRPGVEVRARRGYKAATAAEVEASRTAAAASAPIPESAAEASAALGALARLRPEAKLHTQAVAVRDAGVTVWFTGELAKPVAAATAATITVGSGTNTTIVEVPVAAGQRAFAGSAALKTLPAGAIDVRVRIAPAGEIPFTDAATVEIVSGLPMPLMYRRGPSTGNRYEPAGQPQFSRTERARFDVPRSAEVALEGVRVLDRNGNPLEVTVAQSEREGWQSAEVILAPLAPGDYIVELSGRAGGNSQKVLTAFRVTR